MVVAETFVLGLIRYLFLVLLVLLVSGVELLVLFFY